MQGRRATRKEGGHRKFTPDRNIFWTQPEPGPGHLSRKLMILLLVYSPNSACTMGFWRFQGLVKVCRPRAVPGHAKSLKNLQFLSFFKKIGAGARVLRSTFSFLMNASANLLVFVATLGVTPQLGLQRHLASKGAPKAPQGIPKGTPNVSMQPQQLHKAPQKKP